MLKKYKRQQLNTKKKNSAVLNSKGGTWKLCCMNKLVQHRFSSIFSIFNVFFFFLFNFDLFSIVNCILMMTLILFFREFFFSFHCCCCWVHYKCLFACQLAATNPYSYEFISPSSAEVVVNTPLKNQFHLKPMFT